MEKTTAGLIGALAGLAAIGPAQAASRPAPSAAEVMQVTSYAELLAPIANASELLRASVPAQRDPNVEDVQYYNGPPPHHHHHHHHHHHIYHRPPPRHYHHHHHHGVTVVVPGVGVVHSN